MHIRVHVRANGAINIHIFIIVQDRVLYILWVKYLSVSRSPLCRCVAHSVIVVSFLAFAAIGPLVGSNTESSEDEGEISSPEVKALLASASKARRKKNMVVHD